MTKYQTKTARCYQYGYTLEEALARGANAEEFLALEKEFEGGSIPLHIVYGFKKTEPYSCDYHTGGSMGTMLKESIKRHNKERTQ